MTSTHPVIEELAALFATEGAREYLGEAVSQGEHMRQAGHLATRAGAAAPLVAAALLHDVGHFKGTLSGVELMRGNDNHHSQTGASFLAQWFGPAVTEPVRLHVDAKRYLCAVEQNYFDKLSAASVYTLSVQGGPMSKEEIGTYEVSPHARDAVALRRFDEQAKDPGAKTPAFECFAELLEGLLIRNDRR